MYFWCYSFCGLVMLLTLIALCWPSIQILTKTNDFWLCSFQQICGELDINIWHHILRWHHYVVMKHVKPDRTKVACYYQLKIIQTFVFLLWDILLAFFTFLLVTTTGLGILSNSIWGTINSFNGCYCFPLECFRCWQWIHLVKSYKEVK